MKKSAKEILILWLKTQIDTEICYHDIEDHVKQFGINFYGQIHNRSTYCREFRSLKRVVEDLELVELETDNNVGKWLVKWREDVN